MNTQGSAVHIVTVDRIQPVVVAKGGYLSKFLLGMCRLSLLPIIDPVLVTLG